nr:response regulator [Desulfobacterales bacterium]
ENGLATLDPTNDRIAKIRALPPVWQEKILIVDDQPSIVELLRAILSREGRVHTAMNGAEGLKKISEHYFAVIISDIDMPIMNGWRFYRRLQKQFSGIGRRFIFITGNRASSEVLRIKQHELNLLYKPFSLADLRRVVYGLMECNARGGCMTGAL